MYKLRSTVQRGQINHKFRDVVTSATQKTCLKHSEYSVHLDRQEELGKEVAVGTAEADQEAA